MAETQSASFMVPPGTPSRTPSPPSSELDLKVRHRLPSDELSSEEDEDDRESIEPNPCISPLVDATAQVSLRAASTPNLRDIKQPPEQPGAPSKPSDQSKRRRSSGSLFAHSSLHPPSFKRQKSGAKQSTDVSFPGSFSQPTTPSKAPRHKQSLSSPSSVLTAPPTIHSQICTATNAVLALMSDTEKVPVKHALRSVLLYENKNNTIQTTAWVDRFLEELESFRKTLKARVSAIEKMLKGWEEGSTKERRNGLKTTKDGLEEDSRLTKEAIDKVKEFRETLE